MNDGPRETRVEIGLVQSTILSLHLPRLVNITDKY